MAVAVAVVLLLFMFCLQCTLLVSPSPSLQRRRRHRHLSFSVHGECSLLKFVPLCCCVLCCPRSFSVRTSFCLELQLHWLWLVWLLPFLCRCSAGVVYILIVAFVLLFRFLRDFVFCSSYSTAIAIIIIVKEEMKTNHQQKEKERRRQRQRSRVELRPTLLWRLRKPVLLFTCYDVAAELVVVFFLRCFV